MSDSAQKKPRLPLDKYTVGWISALPIERAAARVLLDEEHEPPGVQDDDPALYILGRIERHNVVVACLPDGLIGTASAVTVATRLVTRFPSAKIGLMVGIGGGVPSKCNDIRLGDVVVSQPRDNHGGVVQYDFGKATTGDTYQHTGHLDKPPALLLNAMGSVKENRILGESRFSTYLATLEKKKNFTREKAGRDRLFHPMYVHTGGDTCKECSLQQLIEREARADDELVQIHYGTIASGNTVIRDAAHRDQICEELGGQILCFEMEAAGLMNSFPCLVIRGICDYADSHKNKEWQPYAAATAAAFAKEILSVIPPKDVARLASIKAPCLLPFHSNPQFTGRSEIMSSLHDRFKDPEHYPYVAIHGLGGSGKSAIAIEFAHQVRHADPGCAVFWVSAFTHERFQDSYRDIARQLQIPEANDTKKDMLGPVKDKLSGEDQQKWLMIVDNVDDRKVLYRRDPTGADKRLYDYLPHSRSGMILFTTRSRGVAVDMVKDAKNGILRVEQMTPDDAQGLLQKILLADDTIHNQDSVAVLLERLTYLPLAIVQAAAFMNKKQTRVIEYLEIIRETDRAMIETLSENFEDPGRDLQSKNAVVTTWYISFIQIQKDDPLAAEYLSSVACILPQNIPRQFFHSDETQFELERAIGTLKEYDFLHERESTGFYDMHLLIHLVVRTWLQNQDRWLQCIHDSISRLSTLVPYGGHETWREYIHLLPHGKEVTSFHDAKNSRTAIDLVSRIAYCEASLGQYAQAETDHRKVWDWSQKNDGPESKSALGSMHEVAYVMGLQGKQTEAEELLKQVIEIRKRILGAEHSGTSGSQNNLANIYLRQGRWKEAEELQVQVHETRKRVLGAEHPDTLTSQANLANTYWRQGRWKDAEELQVQVLETSKRVLGAEHPDTLRSQANLASTYRGQGRWKDAEELQVQVLEMRKRVLGAEHPDTPTHSILGLLDGRLFSSQVKGV